MAVVPFESRWGTPVEAQIPSNVATSTTAALAPPSGPFVPKQCTGKTKKGHACTAPVVKGTVLCVGHGRSVNG